jgi:hypothetical protein
MMKEGLYLAGNTSRAEDSRFLLLADYTASSIPAKEQITMIGACYE